MDNLITSSVTLHGDTYTFIPAPARLFFQYHKATVLDKNTAPGLPKQADIFLLKERVLKNDLVLTDAEAIEFLIGDALKTGKILEQVFRTEIMPKPLDDAATLGESTHFSVNNVELTRKAIPWMDLQLIRSEIIESPMAKLEEVTKKYYVLTESEETIDDFLLDNPCPEGIGFDTMVGISIHFLALLSRFRSTPM